MSRDGIVTIAIIVPYWLGIAADTLWAAALLVPGFSAL